MRAHLGHAAGFHLCADRFGKAGEQRCCFIRPADETMMETLETEVGTIGGE